MRVTRKNITSFVPVSINLTFESEEELRAFFLIMNWSPLCEAKHVCEFIDTDTIRDALGDVEYEDQWDEFEASIFDDVKRKIKFREN